MTDETTNVTVATDAPPALKSTDTSDKAKALTAEPVPAKAEKVEAVEAKPDAGSPEGSDTDAPAAGSAATREGNKKERLPRWVKERMERVRLQTAQETEQRLRAELKPEPQTPALSTPTETAQPDKTLADFDFDQDAYFDYKVERKLEKKAAEAKQAEAQQQQAKAEESFKARIDAFEERVGGGAWQDIQDSPLNTDPAMKPLVDLFLGDDHDLDIAHHLATNPKEATRLLGLAPLARVRELAKLAEQFSGSPETPAPTLPKKTTSAPPPPKTVSGSGRPSVDVNAAGTTTAERIAAWKAKAQVRA